MARYDAATCGLVITDYRMPGMDGLQLQQKMIDADAPLPVIMVSGYADVPTAVLALRRGALTLLEKPYEQDKLMDAVHEAACVAAEWHRAHKRNEKAQSKLTSLKESERAVMKMILEGYPNKTIASRLDISLRTVERRRHDILDKLGVESLVDLADLVSDAGSFPWRLRNRTGMA